MDFLEKERQNRAQTAELCALAARVHAGTAQLVEMAMECDHSGAWHGEGFRSLAHWLSVVSGYDWPTCAEIVRVGEALRQLPLIQSEFASGSLSFDKVRSLTRVAASGDEVMWLNVARQASGSQLTRICRAFARAMDEKPEHHEQRRVTWWWRDDGMLALSALLSPEDGAVVIAAIEKALPEHKFNTDDIATRQADALVAVVTKPDQSLPPRLVIHVDAERAYIEDGPSIAQVTAQRLACDAEVVTVTERNGYHWMWAGPGAWSAAVCAMPFTCATEPVAFPAVVCRRARPTAITSNIGCMAARPTSPTSSLCAASIIVDSTTVSFTSGPMDLEYISKQVLKHRLFQQAWAQIQHSTQQTS